MRLMTALSCSHTTMAAWVTCLVVAVLGLLTTASGAGPTTAAGTSELLYLSAYNGVVFGQNVK